MFQGGRVLSVSELSGTRFADADAIDKLNKKVCKDTRVKSCLLKIADGVTLCEKL